MEPLFTLLVVGEEPADSTVYFWDDGVISR